MKKLLVTAALLAVAGSAPAFGQYNVLIAGWDFEFTAANYTFGAGTADDGILAANYADSYVGADGINNPVADGASAAARGTFFLNGTNGSDLWNFSGPLASATKFTSISDADQQILTRDGSATKLGGFGGLATAALGLNRTTENLSEISFVINTTGIGSLDEVSYRTRMQATGADGSIDWSLIVGANTYALDPAITVTGTIFQTQGFDLSSISLDGATSVTLVGTVANSSTTNVLLLDNLAVYGFTAETAPIPEPSTYAAGLVGLIGIAALGLRRRQARA